MEGRSFQRESISALWAELEPLAAANLAETGVTKLPLKADREAYARSEAAGIHRFHTARVNGELIGYCSTILHQSHFDGALEAHEDGIYIVPRHRGWTGADLEHWVDTSLALEGVARSFRERIVEGCQADRALRRGPLGYQPHSVVFLRRLAPLEAR